MAFSFSEPEWFDEVGSTNDVLKERLNAGETVPPGTVVAARRQVRGKGRLGGGWVSSPDGDLTFSFYWRAVKPMLALGVLPMACALGVGDFLALPPWRIASQCKWPNDVMVDDAKICGILSEGNVWTDGGIGLVVGIGVNLRRVPGRDEALGRRTATVRDFVDTAAIGDAAVLLPRLLSCIAARVDLWDKGGFAALKSDLLARFWGMGREITAKTADGSVRGVVTGLDDAGALLLRKDGGEIVAVSSIHALDGWDPQT